MKRLSVVLFPVVMATGCGSCTVPFDFEDEGTIVIPLGAVGDCSSADNGTFPEDGEPDEDGNLTTFEHANDGTNCTLTASWQGILVDMASTRAEAEQQIGDSGLDPATVKVSITEFAPTVQIVELRDDDADAALALDDSALVSYAGGINIEGTDGLITVAFAAPGDPTQPTVETNADQNFLDVVNAAYADSAAIPATGGGDAVIALDGIAPVAEAARPALSITYTIKGTGEASPF